MTDRRLSPDVRLVVDALNAYGLECYAWVGPDGAVVVRFPDPIVADSVAQFVAGRFDAHTLNAVAVCRAESEQRRAADRSTPRDPRLDG